MERGRGGNVIKANELFTKTSQNIGRDVIPYIIVLTNRCVLINDIRNIRNIRNIRILMSLRTLRTLRILMSLRTLRTLRTLVSTSLK